MFMSNKKLADIWIRWSDEKQMKGIKKPMKPPNLQSHDIVTGYNQTDEILRSISFQITM